MNNNFSLSILFSVGLSIAIGTACVAEQTGVDAVAKDTLSASPSLHKIGEPASSGYVHYCNTFESVFPKYTETDITSLSGKSKGLKVDLQPSVTCDGNQTATPIIVCDHLVFPTHFKNCHSNSPAKLWAVSLSTGEARVIAENFDSESGVSLAEIGNTAYFVVTTFSAADLDGDNKNDGNLAWINIRTGDQIRENPAQNMGNDSSGLWDSANQRYVFGTVNKPSIGNAGAISPYSGAIFSVSGPGGEMDFQNYEKDGLRGWTVGAPTSDGERFFIGMGAGWFGAEEYYNDPTTERENDSRACSSVVLNADLGIERSYDPGQIGCSDVYVKTLDDGSFAQEESSTTAELPVDKCGNAYWAQFRAPSNVDENNPNAVAIAQLPINTSGALSPTCVMALPKNKQTVSVTDSETGETTETEVFRSSASYYQAPVIDALGNAWIMHREQFGAGSSSQQLWRITKDSCEATLFAGKQAQATDAGDQIDLGGKNASSPMLAKSKEGRPLVYVATSGNLHEFILDQANWSVLKHNTYPLSGESYTSSPVLDTARDQMVVVSEQGIVDILSNTAADNYGRHIWPRMRRNNVGDATNSDNCK